MSTRYNGDVRVGPWMLRTVTHESIQCAEKDRGKRERKRRKKETEKSFSFSEGKKKTVARDSRFIHGQVYGAKKDFSFEM